MQKSVKQRVLRIRINEQNLGLHIINGQENFVMLRKTHEVYKFDSNLERAMLTN